MRLRRRALLGSALAVLLSPTSPARAAGPAGGPLRRFLDGLHTLQGRFTQWVYDGQRHLVQESSGTLALERPDRFYFHYLKPFRQLIVADGHRVWIYDPGLEQVTVRALGTAIGSTPAMLLSSNAPLERSFVVHDLAASAGLAWVELDPRSTDATFKDIRFGFRGEALATMEMRDNFDQTTVLDFADLRRNQPVPAARFRFHPPPGVDVIEASPRDDTRSGAGG